MLFCPSSVLMIVSLLALAAAQIDEAQHRAVRAIWADLNCSPPRCPDFAVDQLCPSSLACSGGLVRQIEFSSGLTGSINGAALGVLTGLTVLRLGFLSLALSTIPTQVGRLTALTALVLERSALTGTVPSEIGNLTNLTTLIVQDNSLTGTLPALETLTRLTYLDAGGNADLGGKMPALPTSIRSAFLDFCSFTALPPNLSTLNALALFFVHNNKLFGPPPLLPLSVGECSLQRKDDTNCIDCLANGQCECTPKPNVIECTPLPTTTTVTATSSSATGTSQSVTVVVATAQPALTTTAITSSIGDIPNTTATFPLSASGDFESSSPGTLGAIIGGAALAVVLIVIGLAVFLLLKRRHRRRHAGDSAAEAKQALPPQSNYAAIALPPRNYDNGRLAVDEHAGSPSEYSIGRL
jgi:hypothetical protein